MKRLIYRMKNKTINTKTNVDKEYLPYIEDIKNQLGITLLNLEINFGVIPEGYLGVTRYNKKENIEITIDKNSINKMLIGCGLGFSHKNVKNSIIHYLAHELRHVKQIQDGRRELLFSQLGYTMIEKEADDFAMEYCKNISDDCSRFSQFLTAQNKCFCRHELFSTKILKHLLVVGKYQPIFIAFFILSSLACVGAYFLCKYLTMYVLGFFC